MGLLYASMSRISIMLSITLIILRESQNGECKRHNLLSVQVKLPTPSLKPFDRPTPPPTPPSPPSSDRPITPASPPSQRPPPPPPLNSDIPPLPPVSPPLNTDIPPPPNSDIPPPNHPITPASPPSQRPPPPPNSEVSLPVSPPLPSIDSPLGPPPPPDVVSPSQAPSPDLAVPPLPPVVAPSQVPSPESIPPLLPPPPPSEAPSNQSPIPSTIPPPPPPLPSQPPTNPILSPPPPSEPPTNPILSPPPPPPMSTPPPPPSEPPTNPPPPSEPPTNPILSPPPPPTMSTPLPSEPPTNPILSPPPPPPLSTPPPPPPSEPPTNPILSPPPPPPMSSPPPKHSRPPHSKPPPSPPLSTPSAPTSHPPIFDTPELQVGFYEGKCIDTSIDIEALIESIVEEQYLNDSSILPALLRLQFHDCFVHGCDASILIEGASTEKTATPNQSVRGYEFIDELKVSIEEVCPGIVSCADIIAIATKVVMKLGGGPDYLVQTGRRDGLVSKSEDVDLPSPTLTVPESIAVFQAKNFTADEMVVLLGCHSVGIAHCSFFQDRLYPNTNQFDSNMDPNLREQLKITCPLDAITNNFTLLDQDPQNLNKVDNSFYTQILEQRGILPIDQALARDPLTHATVLRLSLNATLFNVTLANAMVKLQAVDVLTGDQGEIRNVCSKFN